MALIRPLSRLSRAATLAALIAVLSAPTFAQLPPGMPDLAKARPTIRNYSAIEIDAVAAQSGLTDCFWVGTVSKDSFNILVPDTGTVYWISQVSLPAGAKLSLTGEFPYARYLSFASYNNEGLPTDSLNDQMIQADSGGTNPFIAGARRDGAKRSYRIQVQPRELTPGVTLDAASRDGNTLYVPAEDGKYQIWMRIYVPDRGRDAKGGVPLPSPVLTLADGSTLRGEKLCQQIVVKDAAVRDFAGQAETWRALFPVRGATSPYHPAHAKPEWNTFFNPPLAMATILIGTPFEAVRQKMDARRVGGFYSTKDNRYMTTYVDNRYGEALVIRGKAPTTPRTLAGGSRMEAAGLRYWSFCKNRSLVDTAVDGCLYDEQVPTDANGKYTIVLSTPAQRPSNARSECGVAWLDWGKAGDGIDNPHGGFLAHRHMLAAPDFRKSIWSTETPGDERNTLGEYYPEMSYEAKSAFEARGCPAK